MSCRKSRDTASFSDTAATTAAPAMRLSPGWLLALYGIVPLCLLFLLFDGLVLDFRISRSLPADPHSMQWFTLFFMLPHIFASTFTFLDREYLATYRVRLGMAIPIIAVIVLLLPQLFPDFPLGLIVAIYTMYHLMNQQTGIAAMIARNRSWEHEGWRWACFVVATLLYVAVLVGDRNLAALVVRAAAVVVPLLVLSGALALRRARTGIGKAYIAANTAMVITCYGLLAFNLPFFLILIPRVVHDVSAFFFYVAHNANRNAIAPVNPLARLRAVTGLPEYLWTPAVGVTCTALVTFLCSDWMMYILPSMALFHYYFEGIMWKSGAPHRRYIYA